MGYSFNLDEIFAMAEEIERNGARFYRRAAAITTEPAAQQLFAELARWEDGHERLFQRLRQDLVSAEAAAPTVFDPMGDAELYLQAMAEQHVFRRDLDVEALVDGADGPRGILELALQFERDSILFFLGMKEVVPAHMGPAKVDRLIQEEMGHVAYLSKQLAAL
jgi:rubrerythrin